MKPPLFSPRWADDFCRRLDDNPRYRELAADWDGAVALAVEADPALGVPEDVVVVLDLHRGRCRGAGIDSPADPTPGPETGPEAEFVLTGPAAVWRRVLAEGLDPILALMTGKLKLTRGSMAGLLPFAGAAKEIVTTARTLDAEPPPGWESAS